MRVEITNDLAMIGGKRLSDIVNDNPDLLVFPDCLGLHNDDIGNLHICSYNVAYDRIFTGNLMGFVGVNNTLLDITSRFARGDEDYFLPYILIKVFCPNILNLKHDISRASVFDFLLYLFPHFFNEAMRQGLFKEYCHFEHNDSRVKGTLDVARHIKRNIPFYGRIAYNTREYSFNNRITQLLRHTIEYIKVSYWGRGILSAKETQANIRIVADCTPNYSVGDRRKVLADNRHEVRHPYFTRYTALQKLCVAILRHEELKYGTAKNKIHGILFDGAWLWEEYLNTIFKPLGITHAENKTGRNPIYLFADRSDYVSYPDFYLKGKIVIDAKYKHVKEDKIAREDIHQIITYLHALNAKTTCLAFPIDNDRETNITPVGILNGQKGYVALIGLKIPQECSSFEEFVRAMECESKSLENKIKPYLYALP